MLPWHTKSIFVKCDQPPEKPVSAPFCSPFAGQKKLLIICDSVTEKAKYGKMRQVNAVNGSQMVVKIGEVYYRQAKDEQVDKRDYGFLTNETESI